MMAYLNLRRLALALVLVGVIVLPLYFLLLRQEAHIEEGFSAAVLLDTPPVAGPQRVGIREGEVAPDFELSAVDGSRVRLSDLRGKPVLITFFALWCGSCLSEMPHIKEVQAERGLDRLTVLAINAGETRSRALDFIEFIQAPFIWGLDFDLTVADAYGVRGLPHTVYIDANGVIRAVYAGQAEKARLNAYVDAAFEGSEPPPFPASLRIISTIPRERVLLVDTSRADRIIAVSKALRCDSAYCAKTAVDSLYQLGGIKSVTTDTSPGSEPRLLVEFDPHVIGQDRIIQSLAAALSGLDDPVYGNELEVRYAASPR
jgi:peroxiredoxin